MSTLDEQCGNFNTEMVVDFFQVAYSPSSPELSDPVRFSRFARTSETSEPVHRAIIRVLKKFRWRKLAKIARDFGFIQHVRFNDL